MMLASLDFYNNGAAADSPVNARVFPLHTAYGLVLPRTFRWPQEAL